LWWFAFFTTVTPLLDFTFELSVEYNNIKQENHPECKGAATSASTITRLKNGGKRSLYCYKLHEVQMAGDTDPIPPPRKDKGSDNAPL